MKQRKIILSLVFIFVLLLQVPAYADYYPVYYPSNSEGWSVATGDTMYVVSCDVSVSLRYFPSTDSEVITQVPLFDAVTFLGDVGNGFLYVNYNGLNGYILASYLDYYEPQIAVSRYGWIVNVNESATLRSLPSTDSAAYAYIPKGTMVTDIADINNKFYKVIYNGVKGYVLKDLVLVDYNW